MNDPFDTPPRRTAMASAARWAGAASVHRCAACLLGLVLLSQQGSVQADSALPLLSGFDPERLTAIHAEAAQPNRAELAKLLYRLDQLDAGSLARRVDESAVGQSVAIGDAVNVGGIVRRFEKHPVPGDLVEFLEFSHYVRIEVEPSRPDAEHLPASVTVYVSRVPETLSVGDSISADGVVIGGQPATDGNEASLVMATGASALAWTPSQPLSVGWKLLAEQGVDIASVIGLADRNRQPLKSEDSDAFYAMLAAAQSLAGLQQPVPEKVDPGMLLQKPQQWVGDWIRLQAETVRVTRIAVTSPARQQQLGSDGYFQIDAIGDLGNVVVQLERPEGDPVQFENRYPISIATARLPEFLERQMRDPTGEPTGVKLLSARVEVDGFFFRLWSHDTDRMNRDGQGEQITPLVIASRFRSLERPGSDPVGVSKIGYLAAAAVCFGLGLVWLWHLRNSRRDAAARGAREDRRDDDVAWLQNGPRDAGDRS